MGYIIGSYFIPKAIFYLLEGDYMYIYVFIPMAIDAS